jgi:hypothetical protein
VPVRGRTARVVSVIVRSQVSARPLRPESITLEGRGGPVVPSRVKSRPLRPQCVPYARHSSRVCAVLAGSGRLAWTIQSIAVCLVATAAKLSSSLVPPLRAGDEAGWPGPATPIRPVIAGVTAPINASALPCGVVERVSPGIRVPGGIKSVRLTLGRADPMRIRLSGGCTVPPGSNVGVPAGRASPVWEAQLGLAALRPGRVQPMTDATFIVIAGNVRGTRSQPGPATTITLFGSVPAVRLRSVPLV